MFNLKKLLQDVEKRVNPFDGPKGPQPASTAQPSLISRVAHDVTHNPVTNAVGNVEKAAVHTVAQAPKFLNPVADVGKLLQATTPHIPEFSPTSPLRFANQPIESFKKTGMNVSQLAQAHNPYHGTVGQQIGQVGQDALNIASGIPIGAGANIARQASVPILTKAIQGAKFGAVAGGGFNAAQGLSTALQQQQNFPQALKTTGTNALVGAGFGGVLGAAAPLAHAGVQAGAQAIENRVPIHVNEAGGVPVNPAGDVNVPQPTTKLVPPVVTPDDLKVQQILKTGGQNSNRSEGLRAIEQNPNMTPEQKLVAAGGDIAQTGLPRSQAEHDAIMAAHGVNVQKPNTTPFPSTNLVPKNNLTPDGNLATMKGKGGGVASSNTVSSANNPLSVDGKKQNIAQTSAPNFTSKVNGRSVHGKNATPMPVSIDERRTAATARPGTPQNSEMQPALNAGQLKTSNSPILNRFGQVADTSGQSPSAGNTTTSSTRPFETSGKTPSNAKPPITQNSLTSGAKAGRQNLSPEVASQVSGEGFVRDTKALQDAAIQNADKQGLDKTISSAHDALGVAPGQIDDATVAHVQQAIERADAAGRTHDAVGLHDALSEHLRKQGQTIQAASLLYKLSPQGLFYKGVRDLKKSGSTVTPELENKLRGLTEKIKQTADPEAKQYAQAEFHKLVADNLKQKASQNIISVWKAGLLSGPLTHAGNFASNETFNALKNVSNPISAGVDKLISLGTGKRTKVATLRGTASGTKQGIKAGVNTVKTGIDVRNIEGNKYEIHGEINFKNPVVQKVFGDTSNTVFRLMSAGDQPVYYRNLKQNLFDVALADGKTKGLKGKALTDHANKLVVNPTTKIAETAKLAAQKSVLGQDSKIASSISKFAQEHPVVQGVVPFVKVPTNFLTRTLDFTPAGAIRTAAKQIRSKQFDQRALSEAIGEATTGTAIIYLGAELANNGMLSGQYPSSDQKEVQRWKTEGIQPNSVKIGGKWVNLNYLGPVGLLFGAGKDYQNAKANGDNATAASIAGFGKNLAGQSFLTGFSGAANAINDPGRYGANFVHSQAASVVPAWLNAVGNATDKNQRQASNTVDSVKARVPGIRNSLPVKQDVYGNDLKQRTNPLDVTIDPLKPANDLSHKNDVVAEVNRLHSIDPNNNDLQVTPTPVGKSIKVGKDKVSLTSKQQYDLQKQIGQATQNNWGKLIKMPEYQALDDAGKANALNGLRQAATEDAQREYVVANSLGAYNKQESKAGVRAANGELASFAKEKGNSTSPAADYYKAPDAEYKALKTKYDTAIKDKTYGSDAKRLTAEKELNKAKVGAPFDKSIRDLYGLSDKDLYQYVTTNPKGKELADKVLAYGDALVSAGIETKNKFKSKYGVTTLGSSTKAKSTGGSSKKGSKTGKASASGFISAMNSSNATARQNQNALLNLVKGSKISSSKKKLNVTKVALKKQVVKKGKTA